MTSKQIKRWQFSIILAALTIFSSASQNLFGQAQSVEQTNVLNSFHQFRSAETDAPDELYRIRQQTKLMANDPANDDNFGWRVAVAGDTAVIGALHDDIGANADQGSAYVFVRTAGVWNFSQKLTASDGAANDSFGTSVAIANTSAPAQTVITVGAVADDIGANPNQGSVYIFVRSSPSGNFNPQGKLTASDGAANDSFGASVAMTGSFIAVGANSVNVGANLDQGAVYIFVRSGTIWVEEQRLTAQFGNQLENMGWSVDISGTTVIAGTNQQQSSERGRAFVFTRSSGGNTWLPQATISSGQTFGTSVAIDSNTAVVGEFLATVDSNAGQGRAFIFTRTGTSWNNSAVLSAADGAAGDEFGVSVDVSGSTVVVGAHSDTLGGSNFRGSAYVFARSGFGWTQRQKLFDSTGAIGDRFGNGIAISGATILVGAWQDDIGPLGQAGSASVFYLTAPYDFDGDGKTDVSVFRPSNGVWYINTSSQGFYGVGFGQNGDLPAPGDFDGDGKTDVSVFRPSDGTWYRLNSSTNAFVGAQFGQAGDIPRPADFDGDGKTDINLFRPSNGIWYRLNSTTGGFVSAQLGQSGDKPLVADFDGDGKADVSVFRPSAGVWYYIKSTDGSPVVLSWGQSGDIPTPSDYDGDGRADLCVFRPSNGIWYRLNSSNGIFVGTQFGQSGDVPTIGDYDGDGKADVSIFRPSNGFWYQLNSSDGGVTGQIFGISTDLAIPAAFD